MRSPVRAVTALLTAGAVAGALGAVAPGPAQAGAGPHAGHRAHHAHHLRDAGGGHHGHRWHRSLRDCPPRATALGYSDALDKLRADGAEVGGLSGLVRDSRRHAYAAIEDHSGDQATRMWFFRDPRSPQVTGTMTLTQPDGTAYTGADFDAEGITVLPRGRYLVSSEVEPSLHLFDRSGREVGTLPVPARFRVAPEGEATDNATLEGLTVSRDGRHVYAAMEGTLSGDVAADGTDTYRRILVYVRGHHGDYRLQRQVGYRVDPGMRISEVQAYGRHGLLVMEAYWDSEVGNLVRLYAVPRVDRAPSVQRVGDLGDHPRLVAAKTLVSDVTACPTLGATAKEAQTNPLMDNYEAMAVRPLRGRGALVLLLSDDNFDATQTTRLLRLGTDLPR